MAWLKERKGTWFAKWRDADGKEIVKSTKVKLKPADGMKSSDAKKLAQLTADNMERAAKGNVGKAQALQAVRSAFSVADKVPSVKEYLDHYRSTGKQKYSDGQKRAFKVFLEFLGKKKSMRLDCVTTALCQDFLDGELKRVSSGTVGLYRGSLVTAFNRAVASDFLDKNPMQYARLPREASRDKLQKEPFTAADVACMVTRFTGEWPDIIRVTIMTGGQRMGDVVSMLWEQVDFEEKVIRINTGKTGATLNIPLFPALMQVMCKRYENRHDDGFVFPIQGDSYQRSQGAVSAEFSALLRAHGITGRLSCRGGEGDRRRVSSKSFHSLRHTVVSLLRSSGVVSPDLCRAIVGHDSEAIEQAYFTASQDDKERGLVYLSQAFDLNSETSEERGCV